MGNGFRGFIFTMDTIMALVPIFIIAAAVTTSSSPGEMAGMQIISAKDSMVASNSLYVITKGDVLADVARYVVSGDTSQAEAVAGMWLNSTVPDHFKYKMTMVYPNGTSVDVVGTDPPANATVSVTSQVVPVFQGGEGYLGQAWYVGIPPSINMDADEVMTDQNGDGVVNVSDTIYLGRCNPGSTTCTGNNWYEFNFTVPGTPLFTVFVFTTNSDHHGFYVEIKNSDTGGAWVPVATIRQLWYSTQIDLTKWTMGSGNLNEVRIKLYRNVHRTSSRDKGIPEESYIRGNSVVVSTYGTGVNVRVDVNDSSTDPTDIRLNDPDFTLNLNTPDPASYGRLSFTRLYLPAAWRAYRIRVWVDGTLRFDTGYGTSKGNWDNAATPAIIDLREYLESQGSHTLTVDMDGAWSGNPWYASPTLVRTYISGPILLKVVNLPYNPPWPNPGGDPYQTYNSVFTLPDPSMPVNVSSTNGLYLLNADEDADTAVVVLNGITEINDSSYNYERYKFITGDLINGSNNITTTLNNTKGDDWYVQGPGNQLLVGYEMGKLAFASEPGTDVETAKKKALEELLIKMGYDTDMDDSISAAELDNVKGSGVVSYTGSAPPNWVTDTNFVIDWASSDTKATASQRTGQDPQQVVFKLYIWRE